MVQREQYERLARHLRSLDEPRVEMTFGDVARIVGTPLPSSAYHHAAWWGSDPKHTQATWWDEGYKASPNLMAQRVVFAKV